MARRSWPGSSGAAPLIWTAYSPRSTCCRPGKSPARYRPRIAGVSVVLLFCWFSVGDRSSFVGWISLLPSTRASGCLGKKIALNAYCFSLVFGDVVRAMDGKETIGGNFRQIPGGRALTIRIYSSRSRFLTAPAGGGGGSL